ncbi:DUF4129 domain-containing protein [bacterium]|nr:DUF4129 domain-containing protein [bacterium]
MSRKDVAPVLEELSKEYNFQETPEFIKSLQHLWSELMRIINDLLRHFRPIQGPTDTSALSDLLQIGLIIAGCLSVGLVIFLAVNKINKAKKLSNAAFKGAEEVEELLDSAGWRRRAKELKDRNDWNKACRALYLSVLYLLDEKSVLSYTPTRSNYEYWYALAARKEIQASFRELADRVDLIWFGEYTASAADYQTCQDLSQLIENETNKK